MPSSIHLICGHDDHGRPNNVTFDGKERAFWSGRWALSTEEAERLVGGWLYLHTTKATSSYYGGTILDWKTVSVAALARSDRILLKFQPAQAARERSWRGKDHGRAWTSGLVEMDMPHEGASGSD